MVQFLNIIALLGAVAGGITLLGTFASSKSAPQEAAGAAIAVALAVIPYVFARSVQIVRDRRDRAQHWDRVLDKLDAIERAADRAQRAAAKSGD